MHPIRPVNRLEAKLPVASMKTYQIVAPIASHFRPATCAEVDCVHYLEGWASPINESTELGKTQAWYIRNQSGRRYREDRGQAPGITLFVFEPGQQCFNSASHRMKLDRPSLYVVRGGDWRGNPTGQTRMHVNADDWVDDFMNHQAVLADQLEKG